MGVDLNTYLNFTTDLTNLYTNSSYFSSNSIDDVVISYSLFEINSSVFDIGKNILFQINSSSFRTMKIVGITDPSTNGLIGLRSGNDPSLNIWLSNDAAKSIMNEILDNPSTAVGSSRWYHYESKSLNSSAATSEVYSQIVIKTSLTTINETNAFMSSLQMFMDNQYHRDYQVFSPQLTVDSFSTTQQTFELFINLVSIIAVITGSMGIIIAQLVGVESRLKEFAILKASGWKNSHLISEVILESVTLGIVGAIVGLLLSGIFISLIKRIFHNSIGNLILVSPIAILYSLLLAIVIAIIGGLYPSLKVSAVKPMEILRAV